MRDKSLVVTHTQFETSHSYGVATISRLLKMTGLFCKRALQERLYFAKETYNFTHQEMCVCVEIPKV